MSLPRCLSRAAIYVPRRILYPLIFFLPPKSILPKIDLTEGHEGEARSSLRTFWLTINAVRTPFLQRLIYRFSARAYISRCIVRTSYHV